ncbi:hypothetical protein ACH4S8_41425 [Streptomyces sp. NPDC021080]|uniref:hypothetical protein n=1 Tax=Streptomyces sp. NPDC021080 TaxID=3365110 RepID=UPI0037A16827
MTGIRFSRDGAASTHGFGLGNCLAPAEALDLLPPRLVVHAVEVTDVEFGTPLSEAVRSALPVLTDRVTASVRQAYDGTPGAGRRQER